MEGIPEGLIAEKEFLEGIMEKLLEEPQKEIMVKLSGAFPGVTPERSPGWILKGISRRSPGGIIRKNFVKEFLEESLKVIFRGILIFPKASPER